MRASLRLFTTNRNIQYGALGQIHWRDAAYRPRASTGHCGASWEPSCGRVRERAAWQHGARRSKRFAKGKRGLYPEQIEDKIDDLIDRLQRGDGPRELEEAAYQIHRLKGDRKGAYAVDLSGRHRFVFRFENGDA